MSAAVTTPAPAPAAPGVRDDLAALMADKPAPTGNAAGEAKDAKKDEKKESDLTFAMVAGMHQDAMDLVILAAKREGTFPEKRSKTRAKQVVLTLRDLGWEDERILIHLGLTLGFAGDVVTVLNLPKKPGTEKPEDPSDEEAE